MTHVAPDFNDNKKLLATGLLLVSTTQIRAKSGVTINPGVEELFVYNDSSNTVYWGLTGVTASGATKGIPLPKGTSVTIPTDANTQVFFIAAAGSNNCYCYEFGI